MRRRLAPHLALVGLLASSARAADETELPSVVNLCKYQTAIRNQGARDTCPYFPPVAALEAAYNRNGVKVDLSVEHLIWLRNVTLGGDSGSRDLCENMCSTVGGGNGLVTLQRYGICRAQDLPYHGGAEVNDMGSSFYRSFALKGYNWSIPFSQFALNRWNLDPRQLPAAARLNARYAIERFVQMPDRDLNSPPEFERILAAGHEIIFALHIHDDSDDTPRGEPVWRLKPDKPRSTTVTHFMLMVGYDHNRRFFVVKNEAGPINYSGRVQKLARNWKDVVKYDGYTLIDYNYLAECPEAYYIAAVAPLDSARFAAQRALGQWQVTLAQRDKQLMTGVLCWRRLPFADEPNPNRRIGDLVTKHGSQYRVNAKLDSAGDARFKATLYIDFDAGFLPSDSTRGTPFAGELSLPKNGGGTLSLRSSGNAEPVPGAAPGATVQFTARLTENKNLLFGITLPPNLLVNGSFENGPPVGEYLPLDAGSTAVPGWTVTRGQIDCIGSDWKAAEGTRSIDLHGSPGHGGIEQTFKTTKGRRYRVTFALSGSPDCEMPSKRIAVSAAGQSSVFSFDSTGKARDNMGWVTKEWKFNAVADQTTLEFYTMEKKDPVKGPAIDNVRVEVVPPSEL
jgi:choice-of-anchor C domain-containing protein